MAQHKWTDEENAELMRLHNKKQRAIESAGEYYNGLGTKALKTKIADRAGGRI